MIEAKTAPSDFGPPYFINRELSWLAFNERVLEEAEDASNPLLERLKFFSIFSTNLDEFFEVRVAGIKQQIESHVAERSADGITPRETMLAIHARVRNLVARQYVNWRGHLLPQLTANGICFPQFHELKDSDRAWIEHYYRTQVRPVLTPVAVDSAHPFPQVRNKTLNLIVRLENLQDHKGQRLAIVQLPPNLPRLIKFPGKGSKRNFMLLGRLIGHYLSDLFPGMAILGFWMFRVTRNSELYIAEEDSANLLNVVEQELQKRRRGEAVRLEVEHGCPEYMQKQLLANLHLEEDYLYVVDGPLGPSRLMMLYEDYSIPELKDSLFVAHVPLHIQECDDIFAAIRKQDLLLHHPYESFDVVVNLLEFAATDPQVLAIKQTLYRTGTDTRIVEALMRAVNNGKQVTVVVELRARFDEANNIEWAKKLEEAGVHVVYGLVGLKIHCKVCLIVRREARGIQRYVHISTGNYNPITARIYTDLGLFTCHPDMGEDVTNLFNLLTGICQFPGMRRLLVAPFEMQEKINALIDREAAHARQGLPAHIRAKMNSLVNRETIEALYRASRAGVRIELMVRGICCLRPGIPGVSENIKVTSVVDRFLEHARVFYFANACQPAVYVGSADWMPRNFFRRVEVIFPILDGRLSEHLCEEVLAVAWADNVKARRLSSNGSYRLPQLAEGEPPVRSQVEFLRRAQQAAKPMASISSNSGKKNYPRVRIRARPPVL